MNPAVLSWNAASNNQALNAPPTSYILNSISAYRTAQDNKLPVADDIFFVPRLKGPRGTGMGERHVMGHLRALEVRAESDVAKQFLLDLIAHYRDACRGASCTTSPPTRAPWPIRAAAGAEAAPATGGSSSDGQRSVWSNPPTKLRPIATALQWATNIGHPGRPTRRKSECSTPSCCRRCSERATGE